MEDGHVFKGEVSIHPADGSGFTITVGSYHDGKMPPCFAFSNIEDLMSFLIKHARAVGLETWRGTGGARGAYDASKYYQEMNPTTAKADVCGEEFLINT